MADLNRNIHKEALQGIVKMMALTPSRVGLVVEERLFDGRWLSFSLGPIVRGEIGLTVSD